MRGIVIFILVKEVQMMKDKLIVDETAGPKVDLEEC